ncbi:hypothetical protein FBALC1_04027 [Flavobacteriales bacterium ALC-1]|nr:hypothetical protein FBALC1_04027 [Flavobacteriales bacterium ALC-1]
MKKIINYIMVGILVSFAYNCEEDLPSGSTNYVTFETSPSGFTVDKDATTSKDIFVYAGNKTGSARTFNVSVDASSTLGASYSVPSTVTIPANSNVGALPVSITDDNTLEFVPQTLVLNIQEESGTDINGSLVINVTESCPGTLVQFFLDLDTWPDETTWEIYDLSGTPTVIFSGGPYNNPADDFANLFFEFCLLPGDYGVVVYDSYGDGGPTYSVKAGATTLVGSTTLGGSSSSNTFTIE